MIRFNFYLPESDRERLEELASSNGKSVADCLRWAVSKVLLPMHACACSGAGVTGVQVLTTSGRLLAGGF